MRKIGAEAVIVEREHKTLLVIAGEFPPLKTIGRIRTAKFVAHLREHDWRCVVMTVRATGLEPNYDANLQCEILPDTEVIRVPRPDVEVRVASFMKLLIGRWRKSASSEQALPITDGATENNARTRRSSGSRLLYRAQRLLRLLLRYAVYIPDEYWPWAINATRAACRRCREGRVDAIYTTLPPFSSALVGYRLKRHTGLPWVVDYRDLWYGDVLREWVPLWRRALELRLERRLLRRADIIITVSKPKTAFMQTLHPGLRCRWETLTNGIDTETYKGLARTRPFDDSKIEFVYTGRLFKNRKGYAFAEALGRIAQSDPALARRACVRILGDVSAEIRARYEEILTRCAIAELFFFEGDVSQSKALEAQVNCDYLLLIVDTGQTSDGVIPGKLFEYIAARRPIFALCDPGVTQEIIERSGAGCVVAAEDIDACERALRSALTMSVVRDVHLNDTYLSQFKRSFIAARLAKLLSDMTKVERHSTSKTKHF